MTYVQDLAYGYTARPNPPVLRTDGSKRFRSDEGSSKEAMFISKVGAVIALVAGTGGALTADYVAARHDRGYRLPLFANSYRQPVAAVRRRTPLENLARVREVLAPTVAELGRLCAVSRQAVYNWQAGQTVALQNEQRLEKLAGTADFLASHGLAGDRNLLRRKLPGGANFYEAVEAGEAPEVVAERVLALLEKEASQRSAVSKRFASRTRQPIDFDDIGALNLDRNG
jgi:hypothetical protein